MALSQETKDKITSDIKAWLTRDEWATFNVALLAMSYDCYAQEITPLVRKWVKEGWIVVAYKGYMGHTNYRINVGTLASLIAAVVAGDELAYHAALDYIQEQKDCSEFTAMNTLHAFLPRAAWVKA